METATRVDALALFARALRQEYGQRLTDLFALADHPAGAGDPDTICLVAIIENKTWHDVDRVADVASRIAASLQGAYDLRPFVLDASERGTAAPLALAIRDEGVRL